MNTNNHYKAILPTIILAVFLLISPPVTQAHEAPLDTPAQPTMQAHPESAPDPSEFEGKWEQKKEELKHTLEDKKEKREARKAKNKELREAMKTKREEAKEERRQLRAERQAQHGELRENHKSFHETIKSDR